MTEFPDAWEPLGPRWASCGCCVVVDYVALLEVTEEAS